MLAAGVAHFRRAVALGEHDHRTAGGLELIDIAVHAAGRRRAERAGRIPRRGLGRTGVIDRVVLEIVRHGLARFQPRADLGMREVARHDHRTGQRKPCLDRVFAERGENFRHRFGEIDLYDVAAERRFVDMRHEARGIVFQLLHEHALLGDLALGLTVGRAGHADADRQRRAMARQADHPHVMAEILAAELRADAHRLSQLVDLFLHRDIAERMRVVAARRRQFVIVAGGRHFDGLEVQLGRQAADDDGEVIGRAGRRAERQNLLLDEADQTVMRQQRGRRLVEEGLVGGAAALHHEQELVGVLALGIDVDLRGQVVLRVLLFEHRDRRELRIAQVFLFVRVAHALGDRALVLPVGEDEAALLGHHDRRARVLAHRQHAAGRNVGVLEQVVGDELVVRGRFRVVENFGELREMARAQEMIGIDRRFFREPADRFAVHDQEFVVAHLLDAHAFSGDQTIGRLVFSEREEGGVLIGHGMPRSREFAGFLGLSRLQGKGFGRRPSGRLPPRSRGGMGLPHGCSTIRPIARRSAISRSACAACSSG